MGKGRSHTDSDQASMGAAEPLKCPFSLKKIFHGDGSVTGSIVVMQHPRVRNLCPDTMKPFYESFKDLTIVLFRAVNVTDSIVVNI